MSDVSTAPQAVDDAVKGNGATDTEIFDKEHLATQTRYYTSIVCSVLLSAFLLVVSLVVAKSVEVLSTWLWSEAEGQEPPFDVAVLVAATGIIGAVTTICLLIIDMYEAIRRAVHKGKRS